MRIWQLENAIRKHIKKTLPDGTAHIWTPALRHYPNLRIWQPVYAIPEHQQMSSLHDRSSHMCVFFSLKKRFMCFRNRLTCMTELPIIWAFGRMKTRFLSINKSNFPQDCTAHIWAYGSMKTPFHSIIKWHHGMRYLLISERLAGWKRLFWAFSNQHPSMKELLISEYLATGKPDSWASTNDIPARWLCSCLSVRQGENAIPEHQQFLSISNSTSLYDVTDNIWVFGTLTTRFLSFCKTTPMHDGKLIMKFLSINKLPPCTMALLISDRYRVKRVSWA